MRFYCFCTHVGQILRGLGNDVGDKLATSICSLKESVTDSFVFAGIACEIENLDLLLLLSQLKNVHKR